MCELFQYCWTRFGLMKDDHYQGGCNKARSILLKSLRNIQQLHLFIDKDVFFVFG